MKNVCKSGFYCSISLSGSGFRKQIWSHSGDLNTDPPGSGTLPESKHWYLPSLYWYLLTF